MVDYNNYLVKFIINFRKFQISWDQEVWLDIGVYFTIYFIKDANLIVSKVKSSIISAWSRELTGFYSQLVKSIETLLEHVFYIPRKLREYYKIINNNIIERMGTRGVNKSWCT